MAHIDNQLMMHIYKNDIEGVIKTLDNGADIDCFESSAIKAAIDRDNYQLVKLLVDRGANIDHYANDLLHIACCNDEIVKLLLDEKIKYINGDQYSTNLFDACLYHDNSYSLLMLIEYNMIRITADKVIYFHIDDSFFSIFDVSLRTKKKNVLEFLLNNYPQIVPNDIDRTLIKEEDITTYNFIKMLVNRNLIDLQD